MRIQKLKRRVDVVGALNHIERNNPTANANPDKFSENKILAGTNNAMIRADEIYQNEVGTIRKNAVHGIEVLMTASPEAFNSSETFTGEFSDRSMQWLKKEFNGAEIVSATLHLDESTPHIHAVLIPAHEGKLNANYYVGGSRQRLRDMQDSFAQAHASLGLERGLSGSKAEHEKIAQMYSCIDSDLKPLKPKDFEIEKPPRGLLVNEKNVKDWASSELNPKLKTIKKSYVKAFKNSKGKQLYKRKNKKLVKQLHKKIDEIKVIKSENDAYKRLTADIAPDLLKAALATAKLKTIQRDKEAKKRAEIALQERLQLKKDVNQRECEAINKNRADRQLDDTGLSM
jgi:hypothetical protein